MRRLLVVVLILSYLVKSAQTPFTRAHQLIYNDEFKASDLVLDSCLTANYHKDSVLFYKGLTAIKSGNQEKCRDYCIQLSKQFPGFGEVHYLKGLLYFQSENYGRSADEFGKVLSENPNDLNALFDQSLALGLLEDYPDAINDLNKCISLDSNYTKAYYARAYWHEFMGNSNEALKDYERTIRLDPKNFDAYFGLAYIYQSRKEMLKACEIISKAIANGSQIAEELKANFCKDSPQH